MSHFHLMRLSIEESVDATARGGLKRSLKHLIEELVFEII